MRGASQERPQLLPVSGPHPLVGHDHSHPPPGPEIADLLHLSVKTVSAHRQHIMEKLDLHRPAELIKYAIRKGLVEADSPN